MMSALGPGEMAALLACVALAATVGVFIFWIERDPSDSAPHRSQLDQLLDRREAIFENLRDLRFEFRAGKFSEADYAEMRDTLEAEAGAVVAQIERLTENHAHAAR